MTKTGVTLRVSVTQTDISVGLIQTYAHCPVARAVNRAYWLVDEREVAKVGCDGRGTGYLISGRGCVPLPAPVGAWLEAYDSGCAVGPISFEVDLPPYPVLDDHLADDV